MFCLAVAGQVRLLLHGTTLATNAILERRGVATPRIGARWAFITAVPEALTAMVTTMGFRDVLDMGRGGRSGAPSLSFLVPQVKSVFVGCFSIGVV